MFVNSLGTDLRIWDAVADDLAADFPVLLYDKRGHGLSDVGGLDCSIADHADDLERLIDHVGATEVIVCGLSIGGLIAQQLAARRPERVRCLVLCDTAHKIGTAEFWNQRIAAVERDGIESIADGILERWFTPAFRRSEPSLFAGCRNMLVRQSPRRLRRLLRGGARRRPYRARRDDRRADARPRRRAGRLDAAGPGALDGRARFPAPGSRRSPTRAIFRASSSLRSSWPGSDASFMNRDCCDERRAGGTSCRRHAGAALGARRCPCRPGRGREDRVRCAVSGDDHRGGLGLGLGAAGMDEARAVDGDDRAARGARPRRGGGDARARHGEHRGDAGGRPRGAAARRDLRGRAGGEPRLQIVKQTYEEMGVEP